MTKLYGRVDMNASSASGKKQTQKEKFLCEEKSNQNITSLENQISLFM